MERAAQFAAEWSERDGGSFELKIARGRVLLASGAAKEALDCLSGARLTRPKCAEAWRSEAEALWALGRTAEAEQALLQALELDGQDGQTAHSLGELYLSERRWSDAVRWFQHSLERRDDVWSTWLGLGKALLNSGNLPSAIQCYQRAASLSERNAAVRIALGEARAHLTQAGARAA
jgi:Flp pilus assembly protein TadD